MCIATRLACALYFPLIAFAVEDVTGKIPDNSGARLVCVIVKDNRQAVYHCPPESRLPAPEKQIEAKRIRDEAEQKEAQRLQKEVEAKRAAAIQRESAPSRPSSVAPAGAINLKDIAPVSK